ncbi:MAG: DUF5681 domain-containing protein [Alphaproteobacteria bacterium]
MSTKWKRGQSGNPAGKPPGCKNHATRAAEALLEGDAEAVTKKLIECAKAGDPTALRLYFERVVPVRKGRPVEIDLPTVIDAKDILPAMASIIENVAKGGITPEEGVTLAGIIELKRKAIETVDIERRLAELEQNQERKQ